MLFHLKPFDLVFLLSAVAFNLLIAAIFVAQKHEREKLVRTLGIIWLYLMVPLSLVLVAYLLEGREFWVFVYLVIALLFMVTEMLLDHVFNFDFRARASTHIPYIILEYIALFGLIGIAFSINQAWGFIVSMSFWILMGGLIYLYWDRIWRGKWTQ